MGNPLCNQITHGPNSIVSGKYGSACFFAKQKKWVGQQLQQCQLCGILAVHMFFFSASLFLCLASFCAYRLHEIGPWWVVTREFSQLTLCLRQTTTALAICPMDNQWSNSWSMSAWRNWSQCLPLCNTTTNTHQLLVPNLVNRISHFFSAWTFATMLK